MKYDITINWFLQIHGIEGFIFKLIYWLFYNYNIVNNSNHLVKKISMVFMQ